MKKKLRTTALVVVLGLIAGYGVDNAEQSEMMTDLMVANVEALAIESEGIGIDWRNHVYDRENRCCKNIYRYEAICSGAFRGC